MLVPRALVAVLLALGAVEASVASTLSAFPFGQVDSYRILPKFSSFTQTGGFAGVQQRYRLRGGYDFKQQSSFILRVNEAGQLYETFEPTARFLNADVRARLGPDLPGFIDVDQLLNLENLHGFLVPQPLAFTPFKVYRFRGHIADSIAASPSEQSTIDLFAVLYGPWMYLRGETTPPPHTADYFAYGIRALARTGRPWADMNEDGVVDTADYTLLRDARDRLDGFDSTDFYAIETTIADWQEQYGQRAPDPEIFELAIRSALAQQSSLASVPEPGAGVIVLLAAACWRRRGQNAIMGL